jgi:transcription-repair coupling factor (superfamily II helicase)
MAVGLLMAAAQRDVMFFAADDLRASLIAQAARGGAGEIAVLFVPGSDALPGDSAPPSPANVGLRTAALGQLRSIVSDPRRPKVLVISTGEAAGRLVPSPAQYDTALPSVSVGQLMNLEQLTGDLEAIGYFEDDRVDEPGELALRGQVIDVFPADAGAPFRLEVQDEKLISIRQYDPVTQLTTRECEELALGRAKEPDPAEGVTLLEHLPGSALVMEAGADRRRLQFLRLAADAARRRPNRAVRDICEDARWRSEMQEHDEIELEFGFADPPPRFVEYKAPAKAFSKLARASLARGDKLVLLGTERDLRFLGARVAQTLKLEPTAVKSWAEVTTGARGSVLTLPMQVHRGMSLPGILAVAAADLLGSRAERSEASGPMVDMDLAALGEIRVGDAVIHEDHGLAIVAGIEALPDHEGDAIVLRFAGESRRLVSLAEADRIWRYGSDEDAVTLDKLDGSSWHKRRAEINAAVAETAKSLVALAAERLRTKAPVLEPDNAAYERLSASFPFTETGDQLKAIEAVRADLSSGVPMDRLIIGDVGYGKTEVALRAAALAALAGKQVALVAPTTVLARQHVETFKERFAEVGIAVATLSRLSSATEKKHVISGLADGSIAVVIGTSALAGKSVRYQDLALVIVDEEQRFGAADKAKLRSLSAGHFLAMSATPIPRTLQHALIGLQQVSVLATPPARRQPIRTSIASFEGATVRTALLREKARGGQSFVVVPRIEDMAAMEVELCKLVPELELLQAHGKLPAAEIDEAMVRFGSGEGDVLLATNIIEAGLDVPRANTMIVWRADRFGLSQLHQLRGRVGRGARRGNIHLLTEAGAEISPRTLARLKTLQAFDRLGAGFAISARDLDQRGAGDLLSDEQTGHVKLIGVDLYQHLLASALRQARGESVDDWTPVLNLELGGRFPETWIPDESVRIGLAVRLARARTLGELDEFEAELADRFGELPDDARRLLGIARVKVLAHAGSIQKIDAGPAAVAFTPRSGFNCEYSTSGLVKNDDRFLLREAISDPLERLARVEMVLCDLLE